MSKASLVRRSIWQFVIVGLILLPLALGGLYIWHKHQWAQTRLAELEPRHARLQGLMQRQDDFAAALHAREQFLGAHSYPAEQTASQAGNDAQQRIRDLFAESGLNVVSVQVQAVRESGAFDAIPISLRVEGALPALHKALAGMQTQTPRVVTEFVGIQTVGAVRPASTQQLSAQLTFMVLRARP